MTVHGGKRGNKLLLFFTMKTKQWDKDTEKGIIHKSALDLINDYWDKRRREIYKEVEEEIKKEEDKLVPLPVFIFKETKENGKKGKE